MITQGYNHNDGKTSDFGAEQSSEREIRDLERVIKYLNKVIATKDKLLESKDQTIVVQKEALKLQEGANQRIVSIDGEVRRIYK